MRSIIRTLTSAVLTVVIAAAFGTQLAAQASIDPGKMPAIGTVDERFESYNIEMVEVTGGRFWKPYSSQSNATTPPTPGGAIAGLDPNLFQYRPPIDLANSRLRKLAEALGPVYVRVSGSWANSVYFQDSDNPAPANPPSGFGSVLTRKEWKSVVDFAHATHAEIVTSVAISSGTRDASGQWTPEQARRVLAYTKSVGGHIAATEFMNEPNLPSFGGAPKGYDAAAYARDLAIFKPFLKQNSPDTLLIGPGSTSEDPHSAATPIPGMLTTPTLLTATGPTFDVFDFHLYPTVSERCAKMIPGGGTKAADALSAAWLARSGEITAFYADMRDKFEPGMPIWITETADTACGGNRWASTFRDTFRYLVQHGRLAQQGVKVIVHNTLAASDYGLLDEKTFTPRPNYWAAFLWRKLMGTTVLDPHAPSSENVYAYAQCLRDHSGGVAMLIVNADEQRPYQLTLPLESERYTLTAKSLDETTISLNNQPLQLGANDDLPELTGQKARAGQQTFAPRSITFVAIPSAKNSSCR